MLKTIMKLLDGNEREIKKLQRHVRAVNEREDEMKRLSDEALRGKTDEFRTRLEGGESVDDLLPEAFAAVREASKRTIGLRHFDVQLIGGTVLHQGRIAEMKTGEGKTLVATLPIYLNAIDGKGVHLVTVNDYLAKRDARWMGPIYHFLGLSVGIIQHDVSYLFDPEYEVDDESVNHLRPVMRRDAYHADITYGTNNEFGFDYLRDNMVLDIAECVQRELNFAIVDEVDSILIDEARTPLIISGMAAESTDQYARFARVAGKLTKNTHYTVDEKAHSVPLTEEGVAKVEQDLGVTNLYDNDNMELAHHIKQALVAKELYKREDEYIIKDGEVIIVDEFTGRLMYGRRYSDGLHQAIEAKENVKVRQEDQTLATITFQNYFRLYRKLAGMTGTAATEEKEFREIYNMDVVVIPTHRNMVRRDSADTVYKNEDAKLNAVVGEIEELHKAGSPALVGTRSIEMSERLGAMLKRKGVPHQILNAKYHEKEASIIAQAGRKGAVTIATNMAGRGVDIILGGNPPDPAMAEEVKRLGGLHIIGTERHESRRIDNQLRGRSGRQGDPGYSRFYTSLDDELMRLFGSDRISGWMEKLGVEEDVPIEHPWISKAIENAQTKVEGHHFDIRKSVLEYDDVMNEQRKIIYQDRRKILEGADVHERIVEMIDSLVDGLIATYAPENIHPEEWDVQGLFAACRDAFPLPYDAKVSSLASTRSSELRDTVHEWAQWAYDEKEKKYGPELMRQLERYILLRSIDEKWIDHLFSMDMLREGIGLRGYGQKDPRIEYINEAFEAFEGLKSRIQDDTVRYLYKVEIKVETGLREKAKARVRGLHTNKDEDGRGVTIRRAERKVGRNDPCPCGSGKKYKKCHGAG